MKAAIFLMLVLGGCTAEQRCERWNIFVDNCLGGVAFDQNHACRNYLEAYKLGTAKPKMNCGAP